MSPDPGARGVDPPQHRVVRVRKSTPAAAPQKKARGREPRASVAGDRIAVWSSKPSEELRAARQLVGRAVRRGLPSGDGIDGEVRRAHADGTLWVDLLLDEGGECDELMMVRQGFSFNWC